MRSLVITAWFMFVSQIANAASITMPFEGPWMNTGRAGDVWKSSDHPNGVFVLEFLANFCGACNDNAGNVDDLATRYESDARVQIIDFSTDTNDREIQRWIANHTPNHPVVKDANRTVWRQIGGQYIPTVIVVDCHGEVKYRFTGVWDASVKRQLTSTIDGLLAQSDCGE